jgi:hypothetical protein
LTGEKENEQDEETSAGDLPAAHGKRAGLVKRTRGHAANSVESGPTRSLRRFKPDR